MDAEEIHRQSHGVSVYGKAGNAPPLPAYTQGPLAARINTLRAKVREAELLAVRVFGPGETGTAEQDPSDYHPPDCYPPDNYPREDIILALNRLSSALWWLFCGYVSRG
jgi:ethanolamine utilization cobalamin adenosyltransferase